VTRSKVDDLWNLIMNGLVLDKLQVLLTGVDAGASREVVRLLISQGASVIAADCDAAKLDRLERDAGLYQAQIETAQVDLSDARELRLWESSLRAFGRLPHLMICCCASPVHGAAPERPAERPGQGDLALSEAKAANCPALVAEQMLSPCLFLHAQPLRRCVFDRALSVLQHPTLRGVLERAPGRGVFSPDAVIPYVRIASQIYSLHRRVDGEAEPPSRVRLTGDSGLGAARADAA
jgi:hypothetical protein